MSTENAKEEVRSKPPVADERMFAGVLGDIVRAAAPTTEADPVGVYVTLMAGVGALIGSGPHVNIANTRHPLLIWPLLFGRTGSGRKGEAAATAERVLRETAHQFDYISASGLSSGEGLIEYIRDKADAEDAGGREDKRLYIVESEFATVMARAKREGSTLAGVLRHGWDGKPLALMNRKAVRASSSHVAIVGHITPAEFRIRLAEAEMSGGTYNRFLPVFVERSQALPLPQGMQVAVIAEFAQKLNDSIDQAKSIKEIGLLPDAEAFWCEVVYPDLDANDDDDHAWTEFTRRAMPYCRRIAALFAVLEGRAAVSIADLEAAHLVVQYAVDSAKFVLNRQLRNPRLDKLTRTLDSTPAGLTKTEISKLFGGRLKASELDHLLEALRKAGGYERVEEVTGGRPAQRFRALPRPQPTGGEAKEEERSNSPEPPHLVLSSYSADSTATNPCSGCGLEVPGYRLRSGFTDCLACQQARQAVS